MLTRVLAADPLPDLPHLRHAQLGLRPRVRARLQTGLAPRIGCGQPLVDRRATEPEALDDLARGLALADSTNGHQANCLAGIVGESTAVDLHAAVYERSSGICRLS